MSAVAKERWKILKQALIYKNIKVNMRISVRRFLSFNLFFSEPVLLLNDNEDPNSKWFNYTSSYFSELSLYLSFLDSDVIIQNISGFNNTGNLCVWPSEETLCYYCLKNKDIFKDKNVCEIGGGMTCFAGLGVAQICLANEVLLTDGNELSIKNVERILKMNVGNLGCKSVCSKLLRWDEIEDSLDLCERFHFILSADCLFFEESHNDLLNALLYMLQPSGKAIVFAPRRNNSFDNFAKLASSVMKVSRADNYDETVWNTHVQNLSSDDSYNEDIHYPLLMILEKK